MQAIKSASVMAMLLFVSKAAGQIPVKKSITETQAIFYIPSIIRTETDVRSSIILNFNDEMTSLTPTICNGREFLPVYMQSKAYKFPCVEEWNMPNTVSLNSFANKMSLTQDKIIIGDRRLATSAPISAAAECRVLSECKFGLQEEKFFKLLPEAQAHILRDEPGTESMMLNTLLGETLKIPLNEYNSYVVSNNNLEKNQVAAIAFTKTNWIVSANQSHYILTNPVRSGYEDSARIFSMILILIGFVIFLPSSTDVTQSLSLRLQNGQTPVEILNYHGAQRGPNNMWIVLIDFSTTSAMVAAYQVGAVDFKSAFSVDPFYEHSDIMDGLFLAATIAAVVVVVWFVSWMHLIVVVFPTLSASSKGGLVKTFQLEMKKIWVYKTSPYGHQRFFYRFLAPLVPEKITNGTIVFVRIAYEYCLAVGFLASAPTTMGIGFSKAIFLILSGTLIYAIGRDSAFLCFFYKDLKFSSVAIIIISWIFAAPLTYYGVAPVTHDSSSFPVTDAFDFSVSLCIAMSLYAVGFIGVTTTILR